MSVWIVVAIVIEAAAATAWLFSMLSRRTTYAFFIGFNVLLPVALLFLSAPGALSWRGWIASATLVIYLADMNLVMLAWTGNTALPKLDRHLTKAERHILPVVMANACGWLYGLPFYFIALRSGPFTWADGAGLSVYAAGTLIHVLADYQKRRFKRAPGNAGRLLDRGLWRLSRHPNYFGDFLIYAAWAALAANPWAWLSPATNLLQYVFDAIPKNEAWAAAKYGEAWADYAARTSRFVPWFPARA